MSKIDDLIRKYILLALSLSAHSAEYLDSYFGPEELHTIALERGKISPEILLEETQTLRGQFQEIDQIDKNRQDVLFAQLQAIETTIRMELGEVMSVEEKVENIYGFKPFKTSESVFEEAHRRLDFYLPGTGTILERQRAYDDTLRIPPQNIEGLCKLVIDELRARTERLFGLPDNEHVDLRLVSDRPFSGACYYKGGGRSLLEINADRPFYLRYLTGFLAHELYPGHHTEFCTKDIHLIQKQSRQELSVILSLSPLVFVAEMIAMNARRIVMPDDEFTHWLQSTLLPNSGLGVPDLGDPIQIENAFRNLVSVRMNAVFMYWDEGANKDDLTDYFKQYLFCSEGEASHHARWVMHPIFHVYEFTYYSGDQLLDGVLSQAHDPHQLFGRLLKEAVLPATILSWKTH